MRAILVAAVAVGVIGAGCSRDSGIPAKVSGPATVAATNVQCNPQNGSVAVTGTLTDKLLARVESGVRATVFDSGGNQIGSGLGPSDVLVLGQSAQFQFTVSVNGTPASCSIGWGAGPPPGF